MTATRRRKRSRSASRTSSASRGSEAPLLRRVQQQLLRAPIQKFRNVDLVLGRARDLVDPTELFHLPTRAAERADHLTVERQLGSSGRQMKQFGWIHEIA